MSVDSGELGKQIQIRERVFTADEGFDPQDPGRHETVGGRLQESQLTELFELRGDPQPGQVACAVQQTQTGQGVFRRVFQEQTQRLVVIPQQRVAVLAQQPVRASHRPLGQGQLAQPARNNHLDYAGLLGQVEPEERVPRVDARADLPEQVELQSADPTGPLVVIAGQLVQGIRIAQRCLRAQGRLVRLIPCDRKHHSRQLRLGRCHHQIQEHCHLHSKQPRTVEQHRSLFLRV